MLRYIHTLFAFIISIRVWYGVRRDSIRQPRNAGPDIQESESRELRHCSVCYIQWLALWLRIQNSHGRSRTVDWIEYWFVSKHAFHLSNRMNVYAYMRVYRMYTILCRMCYTLSFYSWLLYDVNMERLCVNHFTEIIVICKWLYLLFLLTKNGVHSPSDH